ncbi:hypothetical protein JCM12294_47680 [Desulfocicer niacini]
MNFFIISNIVFAGGVTIITHGYHFPTNNNTDWLDNMESIIHLRLVDEMESMKKRKLSENEKTKVTAVYTLEIANDFETLSECDHSVLLSNGYLWGIQKESSVSMTESLSGETIIKLIWTDLDSWGGAGGGRSTELIAEIACNALTNLQITPAFGGILPICSPIHLIGHSRGGSLMGALAEKLGEYGLWIDQVTFLDPHPIDLTSAEVYWQDDWGDNGGLIVPGNVIFADNYYRYEGYFSGTTGFQPDGESVEGALEIRLDEGYFENLGGYGWPTYEHSDVHAWYRGTISTSDSFLLNGGVFLEQDAGFRVTSDWYVADAYEDGIKRSRESTGYAFSLVANDWQNRPINGLHSMINGNGKSRSFTPKLGHKVDNVGYLTLQTTNIKTGNTFKVDYRYESWSTDFGVEFYLDDNRNPHDGHILLLGEREHGESNGMEGMYDPMSLTMPMNQKPGTYYVFIKSTGSAFPRYFYAPMQLTVTESSAPDTGEPNDSYQQASNLGKIEGEYYEKDLNVTNGDVDYYKFEITSMGTSDDYVEISIENSANSGSSQYDLDLAIGKLNNKGKWVPATGSWYDSASLSSTKTERVELNGFDAGEYYAIVFGASGYVIGDDDPGFIGNEESGYSLFMHGPISEEPFLSLPNLIIKSFSPSPSPENGAYHVGDSVNWTAVVKNIGDEESEKCEVAYYIGESSSDYSTALKPDSGDTVWEMKQEETTTESSEYKFTEDDIGQRYLICIADRDNEVEESSESDNKWAYGPFDVVPQNTKAKPIVETSGVSNINATNAALWGVVDCNGSDTIGYFQYGLTDNYDKTSTTQSFGVCSGPFSLQKKIEGLKCDSTYHYRAVASNSYGISYGSDKSFMTNSCSKTVATPIISPNGGTFTTLPTIELSCSTLDTAIRYTIDGSLPTTNSTLYIMPFSVVSGEFTLKVKAFGQDSSESDVASAVFVIDSEKKSELSVTPSLRNVSCNEGTTSFTVNNIGTGTMPWTASVVSGDDWLSIQSGSTGTNSGTVWVAFLENTSSSNRVEKVRVIIDGTNSFLDVAITQLGTVSLTQSNVSQLYVSLFGRASEGAGNAYWCLNQENMVITADVMLSTEAAKDYFGSTLYDDQAFIEFIYENTLNKTLNDDPQGIAYWVAALDRGASKGTVVTSLINAVYDYANSTDPKTLAAYRQFVNRVEISNYCAENIQEFTDYLEFQTFINVVDDTTASLEDAKTMIDDFVSGSSL